MSHERKIFVRLIIAIAAFLPILGISLFTLRDWISEENAIIQANSQRSLKIERLQFFNAVQSRQIPLYLLTREETHLDSFREYQARFRDLLDELIQSSEVPAEQNVLAQLKADSERAYAYAKPGVRMRSEGKSLAQVNEYFRSTAGPLAERVADTARQLAVKASRREAEARARLDQRILYLQETILVLALLAIGLAIWGSISILRLSRQKQIVDEQAARISQARKEAIEVVAHDLKNPLASILMSTEVALRREAGSGGKLRDHLERTRRSARAMQELIDSLLDNAKIESGSFSVERAECDVEQFLLEVCDRFTPIAAARRIELRREIPAGLPEAKLDRLRISQVLSNLLGNAFKFTPDGGEVILSVRHEKEELLLSVQDSGPGMTKEQAAHAFERYWQVQKTAKLGTGLGLSIAQTIVEAHGGRIWVESEPQRGALFAFTIPLGSAEQESAASA